MIHSRCLIGRKVVDPVRDGDSIDRDNEKYAVLRQRESSECIVEQTAVAINIGRAEKERGSRDTVVHRVPNLESSSSLFRSPSQSFTYSL